MDLMHEYIQQYGCIGIFLIVFLEYANVPLPSEIVLPMVGFLVANEYIGFFEALFVSILAGTIGCVLNYLLGKYFGDPLVRRVIKNNEKLKKSLSESLKWIDKYGSLSVMISRVIPLIRTFISIPAGMVKMPLLKFMAYSSIGICAWNSILIGLGMLFADNLAGVSVILKGYSYVIGVIAIVAAICIFILKRRKAA